MGRGGFDWIGNLFLLILNLPLIGLWVRMISVPYHLLYPAIMVFCAIGVFSISNTTFDVYLMALFGLLGYVFIKLGCEPTPLLLGFILGPPMEEHLAAQWSCRRAGWTCCCGSR